MNKLEKGAYQAVNVCVQLKPGERVVIITDNKTKKVADVIKKEAERVSPGNTSVFVMEDFGERPEDGSNPLKFPDKIKKEIEKADVSFYAAQTKKGELQSFRQPMLKLITGSKRHAHMPNINSLLMETGMCADYKKIQEISRRVYEIVKKAKEIKVTTPTGTRLIAEFSQKMKWVSYDGIINKPGFWSNLPDGEVATCVLNIEGIVVVDGVLGDYFSKKYGLLEKTPVTLKIENGRVISVRCDNQELVKDLKEYMKQDENANRIGEFAIGTNLSLNKLVGVLLQDEKFPGVHIAIGHGYPEKTGADWNSKAHVDAVLKNPTIDVDGRIIMKNGRFLI